MDEDATYCGENNGATGGGASYIRYEIIEKKGRQMVVPVRYSIRKRGGANVEGQEMQLERQIINNEIDIEYKPN
jgi:hypothetical protein